ncbi:MAG: hypothetical protein HQ526_04895 [Actinobacteria bacterium]|nr:hypothetical protein [Actinomycetota bacterium]
MSRAVIASIDENRRVSLGRLRLSTRQFVVAAWSPLVILDPALTLDEMHVRTVDGSGRLQLRPLDAEILGASAVLVALTSGNRLLLASATTLIDNALRAATTGRETS